MSLTLTIENVPSLPDGGPISIALTGRRGIDIGRDQYLDWTLPDPDRVVSGKHCEVRYRDGGYWLQDVSRNGTFLNRSSQRLQEATRLKDGDRIQIGPYLILARIEGAPPAEAGPAAEAVAPQDYWAPSSEAPPPIPSRDLRPAAALRPVKPDFVDWSVDIPAGHAPEAPRPAPSRPDPAEAAMDWARATPAPPPPAPPPRPTPRRPGEGAPEASGGWPAAEVPAWTDSVPDRAAQPEEPPAPVMASWDLPPSGRPDPMPEPVPMSAAPRAARPPAAEADAFVRRLAAGLGVPPELLSWQDPGDLAEEVGGLLRLSADNLKQLLTARAESRRAAKALNQTMIQALDNNPMKFAPTVDDALRIMLGRPSSGYLDARRSMEAGFRDLKTHQVKTYAAMQNALRLLMEELSPEGVAASDEKDRGLGGLLGSRKARLWDIYTTRYDALESQHDGGMVDAFMTFFSDCYDSER
jgi:type VI secretion system protein ImpI